LIRKPKTAVTQEVVWLPRGNRIDHYPPDFPQIILTTKIAVVDGVELRLQSHNPPFLLDSKQPSPPTKTQLRLGLQVLSETTNTNPEILRGLTYKVGRPSEQRPCQKCRSILVSMESREHRLISLCHIDYCPTPRCRQVYVKVFKFGVYDCIARRWHLKV